MLYSCLLCPLFSVLDDNLIHLDPHFLQRAVDMSRTDFDISVSHMTSHMIRHNILSCLFRVNINNVILSAKIYVHVQGKLNHFCYIMYACLCHVIIMLLCVCRRIIVGTPER